MAVITAPFQNCGSFTSWMSGREPCSQTPTYDTPATAGKQAIAGMLATARIPVATGTPALSKGHQHEKAQPQQQRRQQQQELCGKAIKVAGKEARNMTECGSDKRNWWPWKVPQVAVVFARSGSECLQGSGNTAAEKSRIPPPWTEEKLGKKVANLHGEGEHEFEADVSVFFLLLFVSGIPVICKNYT